MGGCRAEGAILPLLLCLFVPTHGPRPPECRHKKRLNVDQAFTENWARFWVGGRGSRGPQMCPRFYQRVQLDREVQPLPHAAWNPGRLDANGLSMWQVA